MQNLKVIDYTKKRLDDMYLVVYAIKNDINIKKGINVKIKTDKFVNVKS